MIDLSGRIAVVTGGASGIGEGISLVLANQGAKLVVSDVNIENARRVVSELELSGQTGIAVKVDVTDRNSVKNMVDQSLTVFEKIDILVNNAGIVGIGNWWERENPSDEDWAHVFKVNVRGMVITSELIAKHMKIKNYGKIINIASIAARQGSFDLPHYSASKAAVVSWTQSNALQLARYNINVNAICPGLLWTPMWEEISRKRARFGTPDIVGNHLSGRNLFDKIVEETIPMKKEQTPEDIGHLAAFLSSDEAHNITGQAVNVDGGRRMN